MPVEPLNVFTYYDRQRFTQHGSMDLANWYNVAAKDSKLGQALYPAMGRQHVVFFGQNKLIFEKEPSKIFKTINFLYVVVDTTIIQIDKFYNEIILGTVALGSTVWFAFLPVGLTIYVMLTDGTNIYVITETVNPTTVTMQVVTDGNRPMAPTYVASFGNRFVVSNLNTPDYFLTDIDLGGAFNPATVFTIPVIGPLFNRASGVIGQMGVLHNQLYIFCTFSTDVWANIPSSVTSGNVTREFPWKLNTSYNWDFGIADPNSLTIDFGRMAWLAQNTGGLVTFMASNGQQPQDISTQAINVLIQDSTDLVDSLKPFIAGPVNGFLYQYENTILYRVSAGNFIGYGPLDVLESADALEFNFSTQTWARVIELNGERNRIQRHVFFNNLHLVTVLNDTAMYQMAGNIYHNELRTPNTNAQDTNAFTLYPMRYKLVTQQIFEDDYSEFITDYIEIDFVFGDKTFYQSLAPFDNTVFIIAEDSNPDCPIFIIAEDQIAGNDVFVIAEDGNTPSFSDNHYNTLFKPYIGLYYSNDGGVSYKFANQLQFSNLGEYRWRMRWYELETSRNRTYMLVCVSSAPIVILGGVQSRRRVSGGAN